MLFRSSVYSVQPAGSETIVNLKINDTNILVKDLDIKNYKTDQDVQITFDTAKVNVFAKDSGRLIKRVVGD